MKKKKLNLTTKKGLIIFLALFIILYLIIYIVPKVFDIFTQTYIAEYGTLEVKEDAQCLFVRNEEVYTASSSGTVERLADDGQLVRTGTTVVKLAGNEQTCSMRGIVSYRYDGYEDRLTVEDLQNLQSSALDEYRESGSQVTDAPTSAEAGDVMFKIIDTSKWYLVCWLGEDEAATFTEGRDVTVRIDDNTELTMTVDSITQQDSEYRMILSCNRSYEDIDKYRIKECEIVASAYSGIILENSSITEVDGVQGVYVVDKFGQQNFTPVKVLSSQGGKSVVERNFYQDAEGNTVTTVSTYAEIVRNAGG